MKAHASILFQLCVKLVCSMLTLLHSIRPCLSISLAVEQANSESWSCSAVHEEPIAYLKLLTDVNFPLFVAIHPTPRKSIRLSEFLCMSSIGSAGLHGVCDLTCTWGTSALLAPLLVLPAVCLYCWHSETQNILTTVQTPIGQMTVSHKLL